MQRLVTNIYIAFLLLSGARAYSQQYGYDSNGNLTSDANKQIASLHYNHLNLVDTILYADGRKMFYTYTASGQKLREQSIGANGTVVKKRDYVDHFMYANDSLREIQYEDGRAVPILPGNSSSAMEYQYHIKDYLGNVRTTLTSRRDIDNGVATFETANMITEHNRFLRYDDARKINSTLFDHTHSGTTDHYSQRLNGTVNEKYGLAKSLSVMPGDTIKLEVFAKYIDPVSSDWTSLFANLLTQIASHATGVVVDGSAYTSSTTSFPVFSGVPGKSTDTGGPKSYLNWLVFDRNFVLRDAGYKQMSNMAKENGSNVAHERLFSTLVIGTPGYVYTYLSNEGTTPLEVYFDDMTVTQVNGPVIGENAYDPFGLTFNEYVKEDAAPNNFLYNGKEQQKDFDLNWYDYGARMYDAALGRWHVIDPMAEKYADWSPYNYVMNNPIKYVDPDGKGVAFFYIDENNKTNVYLFFGDGNPANSQETPPPLAHAYIEAYHYNNENAAKMGNDGGQSMREVVKDMGNIVVVRQGSIDDEDGSHYNPETNEIFWDPTGAAIFSNGVKQSPATIAAHEHDHVEDRKKLLMERGSIALMLKDQLMDPEYDSPWDRKTINGQEQQTAEANGEIKPGQKVRTDHRGAYYRVAGPTSTKPVDLRIISIDLEMMIFGTVHKGIK